MTNLWSAVPLFCPFHKQKRLFCSTFPPNDSISLREAYCTHYEELFVALQSHIKKGAQFNEQESSKKKRKCGWKDAAQNPACRNLSALTLCSDPFKEYLLWHKHFSSVLFWGVTWCVVSAASFKYRPKYENHKEKHLKKFMEVHSLAKQLCKTFLYCCTQKSCENYFICDPISITSSLLKCLRPTV